MTQNATDLTRRFFEEVCNGRQLSAADELFSADHVYHDPSSPWVPAGPGGMKALMGAYHDAVQDAHWDMQAVLQDGNIVITRWTGRGTHTGDLLGIAPTGRPVNVGGIWMHRIAGGKIVESWNSWDMLGMLQQLGVIPDLASLRSAA